MTDDAYYCRRQVDTDVYEVVCVDCGLKTKKGKT